MKIEIDGESIYQRSSSWGAPIATVNGEYVYKGSTKLGGRIANVSGGGRMSRSGSGVLVVDVNQCESGLCFLTRSEC